MAQNLEVPVAPTTLKAALHIFSEKLILRKKQSRAERAKFILFDLLFRVFVNSVCWDEVFNVDSLRSTVTNHKRTLSH